MEPIKEEAPDKFICPLTISRASSADGNVREWVFLVTKGRIQCVTTILSKIFERVGSKLMDLNSETSEGLSLFGKGMIMPTDGLQVKYLFTKKDEIQIMPHDTS